MKWKLKGAHKSGVGVETYNIAFRSLRVNDSHSITNKNASFLLSIYLPDTESKLTESETIGMQKVVPTNDSATQRKCSIKSHLKLT